MAARHDPDAADAAHDPAGAARVGGPDAELRQPVRVDGVHGRQRQAPSGRWRAAPGGICHRAGPKGGGADRTGVRRGIARLASARDRVDRDRAPPGLGIGRGARRGMHGRPSDVARRLHLADVDLREREPGGHYGAAADGRADERAAVRRDPAADPEWDSPAAADAVAAPAPACRRGPRSAPADADRRCPAAARERPWTRLLGWRGYLQRRLSGGAPDHGRSRWRDGRRRDARLRRRPIRGAVHARRVAGRRRDRCRAARRPDRAVRQRASVSVDQ